MIDMTKREIKGGKEMSKKLRFCSGDACIATEIVGELAAGDAVPNDVPERVLHGGP